VHNCLPDCQGQHENSFSNKPIWGHDKHNRLPVNYHQHQIKKTQPRPVIAALRYIHTRLIGQTTLITRCNIDR
jgi:hypothetical protein